MQHRQLLSNILVAFFAQGISLLLSVALSLVVPKLLGVEEFSYWQLFLFYASFCGFFHFGLNDGVYLIYGGVPYGNLDYRNIGAQFWVGFIVQAVLSAVFVLLVMHGSADDGRRFVCMAIAIYMPINNAAFFLGFIFQASNNTKWFSVSIAVDKLFFLIAIGILLIFDVDFFELFVCFYILSRCVALGYCAYKGHAVVFARPIAVKAAVLEAFSSARVGITLTLANILGLLILGAMRFIVDAHWGIEQFGQLSLAITVDNFFLVFMQQVSMVLFPALRQGDAHERVSLYASMSKALAFFMPIVYALIFPASMLFELWLPAYTDALSYLLLLLPLCVFESRMSMLGVTYFKVLRKERRLLLINGASALMAAVFSLLGAYVFESIDFIIMSIVLIFVSRSVVAEVYLTRVLNACLPSKFFIELIIVSGIYYLTTYFASPLVATCVNLASVGVLVFANRGEMKTLLVKVHSQFLR